MLQYDLPNYLSALAFLAAADVTANGNGSGIDLIGYEGKVVARLDCGNATAGENPTLDLVFRQSADNSTWTNANIAFTQVTNGRVQTVVIDPRVVSRYVRLDKLVGGTNASFPCSVVGFAQKQYNPA